MDDLTDVMHDIRKHMMIQDELQERTKTLNELSTSIDTIMKHYSDLDMSVVTRRLESDRKSLNDLTETFNILEVSLQKKRESCIKNITELHSTYNKLNETLFENKPIEPDPFMVEVTKLLYPNINDNMQLRSDPPIQGVYKSNYSMFDVVQPSSSNVNATNQ